MPKHSVREWHMRKQKLWPCLAELRFTSEVIFFLLQLHEQFHQWSWSGFGKPFGKMASLWEHVFRGLEEESGEATFLAPFHPKSLWEHVFRGFTSEAISLYPVWQKTAPNGSWSRWRSPTKRGLRFMNNLTYISWYLQFIEIIYKFFWKIWHIFSLRSAIHRNRTYVIPKLHHYI